MAANTDKYILKDTLDAIQASIMSMFEVQSEFEIDDVKAAFITMSDYYRKLDSATERPTFDQGVFRWAYIFSYIMRNAHLVYEVLRSITWMDDRVKALNVCMVGGGPGTDIIGIEMFSKEKGYQFLKQYIVLDEYTQWEISWNDLRGRLGDGVISVHSIVEYKAFHAENPESVPAEIIADADLITMIKFLSSAETAIVASGDVNSVKVILEAMKPGARLLYIDNAGGPSLGILLESAIGLGFSLKGGPLEQTLNWDMLTPEFNGLCQTLGPYYPLLSAGTNEYVILRKSESDTESDGMQAVDDLFTRPRLGRADRFRHFRKPWDICRRGCTKKGHWAEDHFGCFECGDKNHWARHCPELENRCYRCRAYGHTVYDECPSND